MLLQVVSHSHFLGRECGFGRQEGDQGMGDRGHRTRFAIFFLIWNLNCVWHMQVEFECFLITLQKESTVPGYNNQEREEN